MPNSLLRFPCERKHVEACPEHFRDCFLGGGLACAAGDSDDALVPMPAHCGGQGLQGDKRIVNDQQCVGMRQVKKINHLAASDDRGSSASLQRGGDKVMRIVTLTADGEKQVSGRERARIDGISRRRLLRRITFPRPEISPHPMSDVLQLQLHLLSSLASNNCRAMATSSNGITRSPMV